MTEEPSRSSPDEVPSVKTRESARVDFPCENCGAGMRWDPEGDTLHCEYCDHRAEVPRTTGSVSVERTLSEAGGAARGFGVELRVARCKSCGARVTYETGATSEVCVYCGSATVLAQEANRNAIRPESLVPLDIGRGRVDSHFEAWLKRLWLRPNDLVHSRVADAVGVYAPFWMFDAEVSSEWSADAGRHEHSGRVGRHGRRATRVRWFPASGRRDDIYDDYPICASKGLREDLVRRLGGFDAQGLVPYEPKYLAGWRAEEYQIDLEEGWARGQRAIEQLQTSRCAGDVPGDTHRNLRVHNTIQGVRWKHVLLPVWSVQYRFRGKVYTVLVNGQTGLVVGDAPYSPIKVTLFVLLLVAIAVALLAVSS